MQSAHADAAETGSSARLAVHGETGDVGVGPYPAAPASISAMIARARAAGSAFAIIGRPTTR